MNFKQAATLLTGSVLLVTLSACGNKVSRPVPMVGLEGDDPLKVTDSKGQETVLITGYNDENEDLHEAQTGAMYVKAKPMTELKDAKVHTTYASDSALKQTGDFVGSTTGGAGTLLQGVAAMEDAGKPDTVVTQTQTTDVKATGGDAKATGGKAELNDNSEVNQDSWNQPQVFGNGNACPHGKKTCSINYKRPVEQHKAITAKANIIA